MRRPQPPCPQIDVCCWSRRSCSRERRPAWPAQHTQARDARRKLLAGRHSGTPCRNNRQVDLEILPVITHTHGYVGVSHSQKLAPSGMRNDGPWPCRLAARRRRARASAPSVVTPAQHTTQTHHTAKQYGRRLWLTSSVPTCRAHQATRRHV